MISHLFLFWSSFPSRVGATLILPTDIFNVIPHLIAWVLGLGWMPCPCLSSIFLHSGHRQDSWRDKETIQDCLGDLSEDNHRHGSRQGGIHRSEPVSEHPHRRGQLRQTNKHAFLWLEKGNLKQLLRAIKKMLCYTFIRSLPFCCLSMVRLWTREYTSTDGLPTSWSVLWSSGHGNMEWNLLVLWYYKNALM